MDNRSKGHGGRLEFLALLDRVAVIKNEVGNSIRSQHKAVARERFFAVGAGSICINQ